LHEVSNALTAVLGWLQRARGQLQPGTEARDAADVAYAHARLAFSVARGAIGAPVAEEQELRSAITVAREVLRGVAQAADRKSLKLELTGEDQDTLLQAPGSVQQILLNLLLNAIAFSPERGAVRLQLQHTGSQVNFIVTDQGPGVPQDIAETLFTGQNSTRPGGAGLGLRYSKGLAVEKGGDLLFIPRSAVAGDGGTGARFELHWPVSDSPSTTLQRSPRAPQLAGLKVLVLEDDEAVTSLLELGLGVSGVQLTAVKTLADFKQFFQSGGAADLALVDLSPAGPRPSEALLIIHSHCEPTPLVVMSGHTVDSIPGVHVAGWLRKPFEIAEVLDTLGRVSGRTAAL
jgi:CheY-like chemotaxis protein